MGGLPEELHEATGGHYFAVMPLSPRVKRLGDQMILRAFNLSPDPERHSQTASPDGLCLRQRAYRSQVRLRSRLVPVPVLSRTYGGGHLLIPNSRLWCY